MDKVKIFDVSVLAGNREELFSAAADMLGEGGAISTVNPEILYDSITNIELRNALMDSLCIPDGVGVEKTIRSVGVFSERFPGVELGEAILSVFSVRLGIIGGKAGVAERAMKNLSSKYHSVIPTFALSGYDLNEELIKELLKGDMPDVVFVCLGSPKQEIFINKIKKFSEKTLFIALGGSVDIYAGDKKRAPIVLRRLRCEWLYRMIKEPVRIKRLPKLICYNRECRKKRSRDLKMGKIGKKRQKNV